MHIENLHIHLATQSDQAEEALGAALAALKRASNASIPAVEDARAVAHFAGAAGHQLTPPAAGEIWPGQGGYYICTLPAAFGLPARHLVLAAEEKDGLAWGGYGEECPGANSQTDGRANTAALAEDDIAHPAANWAAAHSADGHTDFHLPSRHDLLMAYLHAPHLFKTTGWYWSSSQYSRNSAWCQAFEYGYSYAYGKDTEFRARPVRWIQL